MEIGRTKNSRKVTGIGGYRAQKHAKTAITDADAPTSPTGEPNENSSHRAAPAKAPAKYTNKNFRDPIHDSSGVPMNTGQSC